MSVPSITVKTIIHAPLSRVWECWTLPEHITQWCFASADWCAPRAENDVVIDGRFMTRMESIDGSIGFNLSGTYTAVEQNALIAYTMDGDDARKVVVTFAQEGDMCHVVETFDAEMMNPIEMQQRGWNAILDNFKKHVESQ